MDRTCLSSLMITTCFGALLGGHLSANAQTAPIAVDQPPETVSSQSQVTEVVVTAAKRDQRLVDVPNSVAAVTLQQLQDANVRGLSDLTAFTPGLIETGSNDGREGLIIRGIATALNAPNSPVGTVLDGLPINSSAAFSIPGSAIDINPADLERVEILRGPQGTLYGANTLAGLISYVTKDPRLNKSDGEIDLGIGQVDGGGFGYNTSAGYSTPLVADRIGVRISGFYDALPGFISDPQIGRRDVNRAYDYGGRIALLVH